MEHAAFFSAQVGEQEAAIALQSDAVGLESKPVWAVPGIQRLCAVGPQVGHAAAPVSGAQISCGSGQRSLGTHQTAADRAQILQMREPCCAELAWLRHHQSIH